MASFQPPSRSRDRQIRAWILHGDFSRAIQALQSMPAKDRSCSLLCELTDCLLMDMSDRSDDGTFLWNQTLEDPVIRPLLSVLGLLQSVSDREYQNPEWLQCMGQVLATLNMESDALAFFEEAAELSGDETATYLRDQCVSTLRHAAFTFPFRERVEWFWNLFLNNEPLILCQTRAGQSPDVVNLFLSHCLGMEGDCLSLEVTPGTDRHHLALGIFGMPPALFYLSYVLAHAPEQVLERWDIEVGLPAGHHPFSLDIGGGTLTETHFRFRLNLDTPDGLPELTLWSPQLEVLVRRDLCMGPDEEDEPQLLLNALPLCRMALSCVVGDVPAAALDAFLKLVFRLPEREEEFRPLRELPDRLARSGLQLPGTFDEYRTWAVSLSRDLRGQSDILEQELEAPFLSRAYRAKSPEFFHCFFHNSISAGFFSWSLEDFPSDPAQRAEAAARIRDGLTEAIVRACGEDAFTPVGWAYTPDYSRMDALLWDAAPVLDAARDYFSTSGPYLSWYSAFLPGLEPLPLTGIDDEVDDEEEEEEDLEDLYDPEPEPPRHHRNNITPLFPDTTP